MTRPRKESIPLPPALATPDVLVASAAVLDQVAELRTEVARLADLRMQPPKPEVRIGVCAYCGVGVKEPETTPTICQPCEWAMPIGFSDVIDGAPNAREAWRHKVFKSILSQVPVMDAREAGVVFWDELPEAQQVRGPRRWAHLDFDKIRRNNTFIRNRFELEARMQAGPHYRTGDPCPRCGCAHMWVDVPAAEGYEERFILDGKDGTPRSMTRNIPPRSASVKCGGCSHLPTVQLDPTSWRASDLGEVFAELLGLHKLDERALDLGVGWYENLPPNDKRRKLTDAPWQYLGDLHVMRCNIFRETAPLETQWRSRRLWEQINADPRSHPEAMR